MTLRVRLGATLQAESAARVQALLDCQAASRLATADHTLWGKQAEPEASIRLGWVANPSDMLGLVDEVAELRREFEAAGVSRFVLCGMGGSSLAPEVMANWAGVELHILDSTHPDHVAAALAGPLESTAVIVSSKSGTTVETATTRAAFADAFEKAGIDPVARIVIVTDPDSPLHRDAQAAGHRVFLADPMVGGRFSALTAFGLVPAGLAGVDTAAILHDASSVWAELHHDRADNPAVILASALCGPTGDIVALLPSDELPGCGDWVEQLVAESTGKDGRGVLPVVTHDFAAPELQMGADVVVVDLNGSEPDDRGVSIEAGLGSAFLLWEYATALSGVLLEVNPFDQPDVESAKTAARGLLDNMPTRPTPAVEAENYRVWAAGPADTLTQAWSQLLAHCGPSSYLGVQVYGNRLELGELTAFRAQLAAGLGRPVTLGFGPRFLHSTGQFHKGGTPDGVFVQIEVEAEADLDIPGYPYSFGTLIDAQSWGDRQVLAERGRPIVTIRVSSAEVLHSVLDTLVASTVDFSSGGVSPAAD